VSVPGSLTMTASTMQNMIRMCRLQRPQESCGFIVAEKGSSLGVRVHWMRNVSEKPITTFKMHPEEVRLAYADFDLAAEEPVAMFHSHPTSEPIMSDTDLRMAADTSLAYLVLSFAEPKPKARAYQVQHFIGNSVPIEIPISVQANSMMQAMTLPAGPWALAEGNYVRISYQRTTNRPLSTNVAHVIDCDGDVVRLNPDKKMAAKQIPLARIRSIHVLRESLRGKAVRSELRSYAGEAKTLLAGSDVMALPSLLEALHKAFPSNIEITMEPAIR